MSPKTGRNEPCPCGSGKKYKRCCLPRETAARDAAEQAVLWDADGMSEFVEEGEEERLDADWASGLVDALPDIGERFTYDYDFGSTTRLQLTITGERTGEPGPRRRPAVGAQHSTCLAMHGLRPVCRQHVPALPLRGGQSLSLQDAHDRACVQRR